MSNSIARVQTMFNAFIAFMLHPPLRRVVSGSASDPHLMISIQFQARKRRGETILRAFSSLTTVKRLLDVQRTFCRLLRP